MMKKGNVLLKLIIVVVVCSGANYYDVWAQKVDYNKIILPSNAENISVEERLVQLAWENSPETAIINNQIEIAHRRLKLEKFSLLDAISLSGNINEFVINPTSDVQRMRADFYPLYNFNATISLGELFLNPQKQRLAQLQKNNEIESRNTYKLQLRAEVLVRYERYLLANDILSWQTELLENTYNTYLLEEENFKNGKTTLEDYNKSLTLYKNKQIDQREAEAELQEAKVALEKLIGVELESALGE